MKIVINDTTEPTGTPFKALAKSEPRKNCKRCHGRGHLGENALTGKTISCRCVRLKVTSA